MPNEIRATIASMIRGEIGGDVVAHEVGPHRLVAAADVVADAGDARCARGTPRAADRLAVADVPVRAQHARRAASAATQRSSCATVRASWSPITVIVIPTTVRPAIRGRTVASVSAGAPVGVHAVVVVGRQPPTVSPVAIRVMCVPSAFITYRSWSCSAGRGEPVADEGDLLPVRRVDRLHVVPRPGVGQPRDRRAVEPHAEDRGAQAECSGG